MNIKDKFQIYLMEGRNRSDFKELLNLAKTVVFSRKSENLKKHILRQLDFSYQTKTTKFYFLQGSIYDESLNLIGGNVALNNIISRHLNILNIPNISTIFLRKHSSNKELTKMFDYFDIEYSVLSNRTFDQLLNAPLNVSTLDPVDISNIVENYLEAFSVENIEIGENGVTITRPLEETEITTMSETTEETVTSDDLPIEEVTLNIDETPTMPPPVDIPVGMYDQIQQAEEAGEIRPYEIVTGPEGAAQLERAIREHLERENTGDVEYEEIPRDLPF